MKTRKTVFFAGLVAMCVILAVAGTVTAQDAPLGIGETGNAGSFEITITGVSKASEWTKTPDEGYEYVLVAIRATNITGEEQGISAGDFQFFNEDLGHKDGYSRTTGVKADPKVFYSENIPPGETFEGTIVFAMPKDMQKVEMEYREGYAPKPQLVFSFQK
ncbi:MAG: DUF4352 domain-containing protein [Thermovirgaceae bacterium]